MCLRRDHKLPLNKSIVRDALRFFFVSEIYQELLNNSPTQIIQTGYISNFLVLCKTCFRVLQGRSNKNILKKEQ